MKLIIVSGPEATGKTAVGRNVAKILGYQYISKDMIKEALYDSEPHSTWDYTWYEMKAKAIFFDTIAEFINKAESVVIESNFIGLDRQRLLALLNSGTEVSEIYCTARGLTSFRRFVKRNETKVRHKGHHDRRWYAKVFLQDLLRYTGINWPYEPVKLTEKLIIIDSTDFAKVNFKQIAASIV